MNCAKDHLQRGDDMMKNADRLMAQAIRELAGIYKGGILPKPANYWYAFSNLLTFHNALTVMEQKLLPFVSFSEAPDFLARLPHGQARIATAPGAR